MYRLVRRALMAMPTLRITSAAPEPLAEEEVCPAPPQGYLTHKKTQPPGTPLGP